VTVRLEVAITAEHWRLLLDRSDALRPPVQLALEPEHGHPMDETRAATVGAVRLAEKLLRERLDELAEGWK
jgi:hypothetical protein